MAGTKTCSRCILSLTITPSFTGGSMHFMQIRGIRLVDSEGIEPSFLLCKSKVLPLN